MCIEVDIIVAQLADCLRFLWVLLHVCYCDMQVAYWWQHFIIPGNIYTLFFRLMSNMFCLLFISWETSVSVIWYFMIFLFFQ